VYELTLIDYSNRSNSQFSPVTIAADRSRYGDFAGKSNSCTKGESDSDLIEWSEWYGK